MSARLSHLFALLALGLLAACAPAPSLEIPLGDVSPAAFGASVALSQQITVEAPGTTHSLEAALAITPQRVDLVGLAMGMRIIEVHLDGQGLTEKRNPLLPETVTGARILRDVMLAYWPQAAIAAALPEGWRVEDSGNQRRVLQGEELVLEIEYPGEPRWKGHTRLTNHRLRYTLQIESEEV
ncbi:DUF3261 domain-containing protein [Niveibacterium sp. SC-1]|uniref:DUF3261 domain-containing protein n=1 Tax=Niveibacterium sp. SC-1 TaxID=3135646 RepID=UPI00311F077C